MTQRQHEVELRNKYAYHVCKAFLLQMTKSCSEQARNTAKIKVKAEITQNSC